jgi:hypothetical protein
MVSNIKSFCYELLLFVNYQELYTHGFLRFRKSVKRKQRLIAFMTPRTGINQSHGFPSTYTKECKTYLIG